MAAISGGVAGGVAVIVAIAAVVTGVLCYCHSRGKKNRPTTQQPEAEYEEIPGEPQGAIEMKENTAYGPVNPRGGPVYEVPGGSQAAKEGTLLMDMYTNNLPFIVYLGIIYKLHVLLFSCALNTLCYSF